MNIYICPDGAVGVNPTTFMVERLLDRQEVVDAILQQDAARPSPNAFQFLSSGVIGYSVSNGTTKLALKVPPGEFVIKAMNGHSEMDGKAETIKIALPWQVWIFKLVKIKNSWKSNDCRMGVLGAEPTSSNDTLHRLMLPNTSAAGTICWGTASQQSDAMDPIIFSLGRIAWFYMTNFNNHQVPWTGRVIDEIKKQKAAGPASFIGPACGSISKLWLSLG